MVVVEAGPEYTLTLAEAAIVLSRESV